MSTPTYHIIYFRGNRSELAVLELYLDYELAEYSLASRNTFYSFEDAEEAARQLAIKHNKAYISRDGNCYLD